MKIKNSLKQTLRSDLYRYDGAKTLKAYIKLYLTEPGVNYTIWFRIAQRYPNLFTKLILRGKIIKFGIEIFPTTQIQEGLYIGHFGNIHINPSTKIGKNCNLSHGVTIGQTNRGKLAGTPTIGNNVFIGPGAKIIGGITIGDNVAIGANSVVTKSVPDNAVIAGVPAKQLSLDGVEGYIEYPVEDLSY